MRRLAFIVLAAGFAAQSAVVLDRIAVVAANHVIKDSDIDRDIRVTDFLNGVALDLGPAARKEAASRLIDQALIRREIQVAQYSPATPEETNSLLTEVRKQRYGMPGEYAAALARYGITEEQLRRQVAWQATVLHFIEQRFRPGVLIGDEAIQKYFDAHAAEFPGRTLEQARESIEEQLAGERVNRDFFNWLEQARKEEQIRYLEEGLK